MVGKLSDRVAALSGAPARLFSGQPSDGGLCGNEPVGLVVRAAKLLEQDTAQIGGRFFVLGNRAEGDGKQQSKNKLFHEATSEFERCRKYTAAHLRFQAGGGALRAGNAGRESGN